MNPDTPRSNAAETEFQKVHGLSGFGISKESRQLERELNEAKQSDEARKLMVDEISVENDQLRARITELEKDKARLDWLEKQSTLAIWSGSFSDSEYNASLGRAGAPMTTLSTMDDDGHEVDEEIAGANTLRFAIDQAMKGMQ